MEKYHYTEDKNSISLMCLNKKNKDEFFDYCYKHKTIKQTVGRIINVMRVCTFIGKYDVKKFFLKFFWTLFPKRINNYELIYNFNDESEFHVLNETFVSLPKVVVYTSVYGNYDKISEPLYVNDYIKYVAITDQEVSADSAWEKFDSSLIDGFETMDAYHKSKYCKLHPHKLFPSYDYSIWVDGNVQIVADLFPLIFRMDNHFMGTFRNPCHDDIYTESRFCIYHDAVKTEDVNIQLKHYKDEGFPKHFGMREFSIIVRQHNDKQCIDLMEQWWKEVNTYTMRDQLSFPFILWKNNLSIDTIKLLGNNWRHNPRFVANKHKNAHSYIAKK